MNDKINTGGPAFARSCGKTPHSSNRAQDGMTLRDYFAAKAMQGDMAAQDAESGYYTTNMTDESLIDRAKFFYRFADAMIAARGGVK